MKTQTPSTTESTYNSADLAERAIQRRAIEAVIWGMPAVNYHLMYQEMVNKVKGGFNQVLYWSRLLDWKNQTLTPNPDVIYLMPFFNTKDAGPVVLEIPPADDGLIIGSIMNYWQAAIDRRAAWTGGTAANISSCHLATTRPRSPMAIFLCRRSETDVGIQIRRVMPNRLLSY